MGVLLSVTIDYYASSLCTICIVRRLCLALYQANRDGMAPKRGCIITTNDDTPSEKLSKDSCIRPTLFLLLQLDGYPTIPCGSIHGRIHKGCIVKVLLILNVAENVLAAGIQGEITQSLGHTQIPSSESFGLLDL